MYSNTSEDSLYHNRITNSDIVHRYVTLINDNRAYYSALSKSDCSSSSDDINLIFHDNSHVCEGIDSINVVTAVDMVMSTNNPLISVNNRHADHHELISSTTLALRNESHPDRDHVTDDKFEIEIKYPQLSSANLPVVTDSGNTNYTANSNSQMNISLYNNFLVHRINIVVLASDSMTNTQTIRVLDTDVVDFSIDTIYGSDNSY